MKKLKKHDPMVWSKQLVEGSLKMLGDHLSALHIEGLNAQDKCLAELTMHNLFSCIMTACEVLRKLRKEVKDE